MSTLQMNVVIISKEAEHRVLEIPFMIPKKKKKSKKRKTDGKKKILVIVSKSL